MRHTGWGGLALPRCTGGWGFVLMRRAQGGVGGTGEFGTCGMAVCGQ